MSTDKLIEIISDGKQRLKNGVSVENIKNEILTTVDGRYSCSLSEDIERFWDML